MEDFESRYTGQEHDDAVAFAKGTNNIGTPKLQDGSVTLNKLATALKIMINKAVKAAAVLKTSTANVILTLTTNDGNTSNVTIPGATSGSAGVMSATDKAHLDELWTGGGGGGGKPEGGWQKSDLAEGVKASLDKADTALQSVKTINGQSIVGSGNLVVGTGADVEQRIEDLEKETFPLVVAYTANNAGTYEMGDVVYPTASYDIMRKGQDVSADARVTVTPSGVAIASNNKRWTAPAISSGSKSYATTVSQGGQSVTLKSLTWGFTYYRYRGEVSAVPTDYPKVIKTLATQELSTGTTLGETKLSANMYYLFAVRIASQTAKPTFVVRQVGLGGIVSGCDSGVCRVARMNNTETEWYAWLLIPKSSSSWNFTISNS